MGVGPYTKVRRKAEDAVEAVILAKKDKNLGSTVAFFKGFCLKKFTTPRVEIVFARSEPEVIAGQVMGNFFLEGIIAVVSSKNDVTRGTHGNRCGIVEDILMQKDIEDDLNAVASVSDFTVFKPTWVPGLGEDMTNGSELRSEYQVRFKAAARVFERT